MLKLFKVEPIPGAVSVNMVLSVEKADTLREMGAWVEEHPNQNMVSNVALRQVFERTGHQVILKPFERVADMTVTSTQIIVLLDVVACDEVSQGIMVRGQGKRLYSFEIAADGRWLGAPPITSWDEDFEPQFIRGYGKSVNLKEWLDNLWFARDCYRPGTSSNPMDSYTRVTDIVSSSPVMGTHWKVSIGDEVGEE